MALDALLATLERETDQRIAALLGAARAEADALVADAAAARGRRHEAALAAREAALRAEAAGELDRVRREARAAVLAARARAVERVFTCARERLAACRDDPEWLAATLGDLDRALACVPGDAVVRCPPALAPALAERLRGRPGVRHECDAAVGTGFVVEATDGSVRVDATLDARLDGERGELAIAAVRALAAVR